LSAYADSHVGKVRKNNEDASLATQIKQDCALLLVADGVGGHQAGEVASSLIKERFKSLIKEKSFIECLEHAPGSITDLLQAAVLDAHKIVSARAAEDPRKKGMASTLTCCVIAGDQAAFIQVGDSRLYHLSKDDLTLRTDDQTITMDLVAAGRLELGDVPSHPDRNRLSQAVGLVPYGDPLKPVVGTFRWRPKETIMLCTDGLTDLVEDEKILAHLAIGSSPRVATAALIDLALNAGGKDNVSVAVAHWRT
jgi:PPM family protein phosphatase